MTEQNWRDLPAGRELDRIVAERMGWAVNKVVHPYTHGHGGWAYTITAPDRKGDTALFDSPEAAYKAVPHYSTSVDAALTLPVTDGAWHITCDTAQGYAQVFVNPHTGIWDAPITWHDGQDRELALLMCRAWLAWKDGTA